MPEQWWQVVEACSSEYDPGGHSSHTVAPELAWYLPSRQGMHVNRPVRFENVPGGTYYIFLVGG